MTHQKIKRVVSKLVQIITASTRQPVRAARGQVGETWVVVSRIARKTVRIHFQTNSDAVIIGRDNNRRTQQVDTIPKATGKQLRG